MSEIHEDIKEIKTYVIELVKQGAIHNTILKEHEKRSTSLEDRILPIEKDYAFRSKLFVLIFGSGSMLFVVLELLKLIHH